jgi:uncharacterized protein (TIGR02284 family)
MAHDTEDRLNSLLRGELAATETYQQAMARVHDEPEAEDLHRIHRDHREAANTLRKHVHFHGGKPDQGSGAWGAFAKTVEGAAKLLGNTAAIEALRQGELHGVNQYQEALTDDTLTSDCRELIRGILLPQTQEHVRLLARLAKAG